MLLKKLPKSAVRGATVAVTAAVAAACVPAGPVTAAARQTAAVATNPKPCSLLSVAQVDAALGKTRHPSVQATTGGTSSSPVLVCTYSWPSASLVVRAISAGTETASGGEHETGMGPHGLLVQATTYSWVAFIKNGWSVWLIAKPAVKAAAVLALGRSAYKRFP